MKIVRKQQLRAQHGQQIRDEIAPLFLSPAAFAGQFGCYRSPLIFDDGQEVRAFTDWPARRREILQSWHGIMGLWPPLIETPALEVLDTRQRENFTQKQVRVEIASQQVAKGYLLIPSGAGPFAEPSAGRFPAVLVPYYEAETSVGLGEVTLRDFAYQLTKRGFVTLSIGAPGASAWEPHTGGMRIQPLSFLAYSAANCANALAALPEVDDARIGVVGHSYGGKWAMFASCLCEKFACAVWSDPGIVFDEGRPNVNYWEPWYLGWDAKKGRTPGVPTAENPRTGAYKTLVEAGRDLHELHALMAPRPFLVSGGSEDPPQRWTALNHTIEVNRLLGYGNRVAMSNRAEHSPTSESNEQIYRFFEYFLGEGQLR